MVSEIDGSDAARSNSASATCTALPIPIGSPSTTVLSSIEINASATSAADWQVLLTVSLTQDRQAGRRKETPGLMTSTKLSKRGYFVTFEEQ
jgi:hypothetical protein